MIPTNLRFVSALRVPKVLTLWGGTVASAYIDWDNSPDGADSNSWGKNLASTEEGSRKTHRGGPSFAGDAPPGSPRAVGLPRSGAAEGRWSTSGLESGLLGFLDVDPMILIKSDHLLNDVVALPVAGMAVGFTAGDHPVGDRAKRLPTKRRGSRLRTCPRVLGSAWRRKWSLPRMRVSAIRRMAACRPAVSLGDQGRRGGRRGRSGSAWVEAGAAVITRPLA